MPRPTRNLKNQRFGRLVAIEKVNETGAARWFCKCDCGNELVVPSNNLIRKNTLSCGCYQKDRTSEAKRIHGDRHTRLYTIWVDMRRRCSCSSEPSYKNYGGRGITVCKEWQESFLAFKEWATLKQQGNNRRNNVCVTVNGEIHTLSEWSEITGISYHTITKRCYRGWSDVDAVTTPVNRR